jgi:hypothetical protein
VTETWSPMASPMALRTRRQRARQARALQTELLPRRSPLSRVAPLRSVLQRHAVADGFLLSTGCVDVSQHEFKPFIPSYPGRHC